MQRDRATRHEYEILHLKRLAIGKWPSRTLKVIIIAAIRQVVYEYHFLLVVCYSNISISTVSEIPVYMTALRSPSLLTIMFKSQDACAFRFMCKHIELKHAVFPELWVLCRFKIANVTFTSLKVIGNRTIHEAIHAFLIVIHCKHFWDIIDYFPKYKEVTWPCLLERLFINGH